MLWMNSIACHAGFALYGGPMGCLEAPNGGTATVYPCSIAAPYELFNYITSTEHANCTP